MINKQGVFNLLTVLCCFALLALSAPEPTKFWQVIGGYLKPAISSWVLYHDNMTTDNMTVRNKMTILGSGSGSPVTWSYNAETGLYTCNTGLDAPSLTISPKYGSAPVFYIPNSTRIAPHSQGMGLLQYNGTVLSKYSSGSPATYYLKQIDDTAWGTYLKQYWYCGDTAVASYDAATDWTIDATNMYNFGTAGAGVTHALTADSTGCSVLVTTADPSGTFAAWSMYAPVTIDEAKTIRAIVRMKVSATGYSGGTGYISFGICSLNAEDGVYVMVPYASNAAGNIRVYAATEETDTTVVRYLNTTKSLSDNYHDIEIYLNESTTFTVKYDGEQIAANGSATTDGSNNGALAIRAMADWEITDEAANPTVRYSFGSDGNRAAGIGYLKQIDIIEK